MGCKSVATLSTSAADFPTGLKTLNTTKTVNMMLDETIALAETGKFSSSGSLSLTISDFRNRFTRQVDLPASKPGASLYEMVKARIATVDERDFLLISKGKVIPCDETPVSWCGIDAQCVLFCVFKPESPKSPAAS